MTLETTRNHLINPYPKVTVRVGKEEPRTTQHPKGPSNEPSSLWKCKHRWYTDSFQNGTTEYGQRVAPSNIETRKLGEGDFLGHGHTYDTYGFHVTNLGAIQLLAKAHVIRLPAMLGIRGIANARKLRYSDFHRVTIKSSLT